MSLVIHYPKEQCIMCHQLLHGQWRVVWKVPLLNHLTTHSKHFFWHFWLPDISVVPLALRFFVLLCSLPVFWLQLVGWTGQGANDNAVSSSTWDFRSRISSLRPSISASVDTFELLTWTGLVGRGLILLCSMHLVQQLQKGCRIVSLLYKPKTENNLTCFTEVAWFNNTVSFNHILFNT